MKKLSTILCICMMVFILSACTKSVPTSTATPISAAQQTQTAVAFGDLQYDHSMELQYAENFSVDYYKGGYALISITDDKKYMVVPENAPVPSGLDADTTVLQQPINQVYLTASSAFDLFRSLDAVDTITFSSTDVDGWYIDGAKEAMESGKMMYAGKYNAPDYEKIVAQGCDIAVESTMIYHSPEVKEKLEQFKIPVFVERSSYESHPLGRAEWIRLYGVLLGKEALAQTQMDAQVQKLTTMTPDTADAKQSVAFFYISNKGNANVRKPEDYIAKMIEIAGGRYAFDTLKDEDDLSTMDLQMEEFYATAKDADILIYNSTTGSALKTLDELLEKSPLLKNCKAVQNGNVWCTTKSMFQSTMSLGDIIVDFNTVIMGQDTPTTYLYRLQ